MKKILKFLKKLFFIGKKVNPINELNGFDFTENPQVVGFLHFYIKDGVTKNKFIPTELKDSFIERFGHDLLNTDENEVDEFIKNSKQK